MSKVAGSIRRGLEQAAAYAKGEANLRAYRVHGPKRIDVRDPHASRHDARGVRRPVRLQRERAAPLGTRRAPTGGRDADKRTAFAPTGAESWPRSRLGGPSPMGSDHAKILTAARI